MKVTTVAGMVGVILGVWGILSGTIFASSVLPPCPSYSCISRPDIVPVTISALGFILVIDSLAGLFGPKIAFYGEALIAAPYGFLLYVVRLRMDPAVFWLSLLLVGLCLVLGIAAARSRTSISEQSNPMNLPVFG